MNAKIYTDGGARPTNPGHAGFACVVKLDDNTDHTISRYIGWHSNNIAEYYGAIVGIKYAKFLGATRITLLTDSQLVRNHIEGNWRVKQPEIRPLHGEIMKLLDDFDTWKVKWIERGKNQQADSYCTSAIYAGMLRNPFFLKRRNGHKNGVGEIDPFDGRATSNIIMPQTARYHLQSHARSLIMNINSTK